VDEQIVLSASLEEIEIEGITVVVTTMVDAVEAIEVQPLTVVETVKLPDVETVIDCVVSPVDQLFPETEDEVNTTFPPEQKLRGPLADIVGVAGDPGSDKETLKILEAHPELNVKLYVPEVKLPTVVGKVTEAMVFVEVPVHDKLPVPLPAICIEPSAAKHALGLTVVP
jgi:hypothetical protein